MQILRLHYSCHEVALHAISQSKMDLIFFVLGSKTRLAMCDRTSGISPPK
jgi:hypothetical protein